MNYPTTTSIGRTGTLSTGDPVPYVPELQRESSELDKAIQQMFDTSQELSKRLQPVLSQHPSGSTEGDKNPEEAMSEIGSKFRASRRSVEGITRTLREILDRLAV